jgi:GTP pyrophosphokinase
VGAAAQPQGRLSRALSYAFALKGENNIMSITYSMVEKYRNDHIDDLEGILDDLEKLIAQARDKQRVPIYLTRSRVKSADSIYLKTKRKNDKPLEEITDYAGLRVLCLFEQDIFEIHHYIIGPLSDKAGWTISRFKIFNWDERAKRLLIDSLKARHHDAEVNPREDRESGYKSIHYIVTGAIHGRPCPVEIQLRTLMQDVWGELEHALAYKQGATNAHVKRSFQLLALDLSANDMLITHLKDMLDKERAGELYARRRSGPHAYFGYEEEIFPGILKKDNAKRKAWDAYVEFVKKQDLSEDTSGWIKDAWKRYEDFHDTLSGPDLRRRDVQYCVQMENAFLQFCEGRLEEALNNYGAVLREYRDRYVVYFRKGEIHFIRGDIVKALVAFDDSDKILHAKRGQVDADSAYRIKVKLANIYWVLGHEYCDIALNEIRDALELYKSHPDVLGERRHSLVNNLCWYNLEKFVLSGKKESYVESKKYYEELNELLNDKSSSNQYDTAAWFCYQTYLRSGEREWLELARQHCQHMWGKHNMATFQVSSIAIQRNHLEQILNALSKKGGDAPPF